MLVLLVANRNTREDSDASVLSVGAAVVGLRVGLIVGMFDAVGVKVGAKDGAALGEKLGFEVRTSQLTVNVVSCVNATEPSSTATESALFLKRM